MCLLVNISHKIRRCLISNRKFIEFCSDFSFIGCVNFVVLCCVQLHICEIAFIRKLNLNVEFRAKEKKIPVYKYYAISSIHSYIHNNNKIYMLCIHCVSIFVCCYHITGNRMHHWYWTRTCIDCIKCLITMHNNNSIPMKIVNRQIIIEKRKWCTKRKR